MALRWLRASSVVSGWPRGREPSHVRARLVCMSRKAITPRFAERLCSLAESQLQMQTARSAALDGGALGVIAVDAGVAAIIIGARGAYDLWIVALALLGLALGLAVRTLRLPGAEETGPSVADMREARETQ